MLINDAKSDDEDIAYYSRHHVQFPRCINTGQKFLVELVHLIRRIVRSTHQSETHQTQLQTDILKKSSIRYVGTKVETITVISISCITYGNFIANFKSIIAFDKIFKIFS